MNRDVRGYDAARAFRKYAFYGFDRRALKVFEAYAAIRGCCPDENSALDMLAVYDTLRLLRATGNAECVRAVREIYFAPRGRRPKRSEMTFRVRRHAYESNCDERTVYRQLLRAKEIYTALRQSND